MGSEHVAAIYSIWSGVEWSGRIDGWLSAAYTVRFDCSGLAVFRYVGVW